MLSDSVDFLIDCKVPCSTVKDLLKSLHGFGGCGVRLYFFFLYYDNFIRLVMNLFLINISLLFIKKLKTVAHSP